MSKALNLHVLKKDETQPNSFSKDDVTRSKTTHKDNTRHSKHGNSVHGDNSFSTTESSFTKAMNAGAKRSATTKKVDKKASKATPIYGEPTKGDPLGFADSESVLRKLKMNPDATYIV